MDAAPDQAAPKRVRRRIFKLIDPKFQMKYTLIIVAVGVVVSAVLGYFIYYLTAENRDLLGIDAELMPHVEQQDSHYMLMLIGFVVVMALFLFLWGILITHRVAGPIFIISRYLRELGEGRPPQTRPLRRGDELKEFFDTFSATVAAVRQANLEEAQLIEQTAASIREKGGESLADTAKALDDLASRKKAWGQDEA